MKFWHRECILDSVGYCGRRKTIKATFSWYPFHLLFLFCFVLFFYVPFTRFSNVNACPVIFVLKGQIEYLLKYGAFKRLLWRAISTFVSRIPPLKIADSRVPFIVIIPHLAPSLISNKLNSGSRKNYWGPSLSGYRVIDWIRIVHFFL